MRKVDENRWVYPDVAYLAGDKINEFGCNTQLIAQAEQISQLTAALEIKEKEIYESRQTINQLKKELALLQASQINMFDKLNQSLLKISDDSATNAVQIIKKIVKVLIQKELRQDDATMKNMLNDILAKINSDTQLTVEVSSFDYNNLKTVKHDKTFQIIENPNLNAGDIIVTSSRHGLMLNMEEAIEEMLGC